LTIRDSPSRNDSDVMSLHAARGSSVAMVVNSAVIAGLGLAFWTIAARRYSAADIGAASAIISLWLFLSNVAELNLASALTRFLPGSGERARGLVLRSYAAAALLASAVGAVTYGIASNRMPALALLQELGARGAAWFAVAVAVWCLFALQDSVAVALRGAAIVPIENAAFGAVKVVALLVFAGSSARGILLAWTLPMALVLVPMNAWIFRVLLPREQASPSLAPQFTRRSFGTFLTNEYLTSLAQTAVVTFVPVVVALYRTGTESGQFYVIWMLGAALESALGAVAASLMAEASRSPWMFGPLFRDLMRRGLMFGLPLAVLGIVIAPFALRLLGARYASAGSGLLRLVIAALIARAIIIVWMSANRVRQRTGRVLAVQALIAVSLIGSALVVSRSTASLTVFGATFAGVYVVVAIAVARDIGTLCRRVPIVAEPAVV
jgi:O-antigen/teichoic acid export membrane protein